MTRVTVSTDENPPLANPNLIMRERRYTDEVSSAGPPCSYTLEVILVIGDDELPLCGVICNSDAADDPQMVIWDPETGDEDVSRSFHKFVSRTDFLKPPKETS